MKIRIKNKGNTMNRKQLEELDQNGDLEGKVPPRRAGLRADELAPGQSNDPDEAGSSHAAGTPGGGSAAGGLGGTNVGDGSTDDVYLEDAMGSGVHDDDEDEQLRDEPQAGRSGGAVDGTPAGKRSRPR